MQKVKDSICYVIEVTLKIAYILAIIFTMIAVIGTLFINKVDLPAIYVFGVITIALRFTKNAYMKHQRNKAQQRYV